MVNMRVFVNWVRSIRVDPVGSFAPRLRRLNPGLSEPRGKLLQFPIRPDGALEEEAMKDDASKHRRIEERIALHRAFWGRSSSYHPLAAFRVEKDFFFSRHFEAARPLLVPNRKIEPSMLRVEDFLPDYERMFRAAEDVGQEAFWTAEPFTGIPWMEAILGCEILAGEESFVSRPWMKSLDEIERIAFRPDDPWFRKYLEFTDRLVELSAGRFPVGMPIMRGPSDVVGAIMGQTEMVYALADEPERMKRFFLKAADVFLEVLEAQQSRVPAFHGGTSLGFYHVYCPGRSIWFQDDLSAIMSPAMYRDFLAEPARRICAGYDYTAVHLHPASFFVLDELLANPWLRAIEVNKDVGGPSVKEMLPELRKIRDRKNLILWGDLDSGDLALLKENLPKEGLLFHIIAGSTEEARELLRILESWDR